jgi:linoleoyl-CoA desaturase
MALFEWGVAVHDLDFDAIRSGEKSMDQVRDELKGIGGKARAQIVKDYIAFPALSGLVAGGVAAASAALRARGRGRLARRRKGSATEAALSAFTDEFKRSYRSTLWADVAANIVRNFWSNAIIFCGHFPDQTYTFSQEEVEDESKGGWYVRQLLGAANIEGSAFFHVASGNLGYQVEHHLFPDMPSTRYGEIAPKVRDVCKRYGLPYNTGPFSKQWGSVQRTILRLAFPGGKPRPKPGPYQGHDTDTAPAARPSTNGHSPDSNGKPAATEHAEAEGPVD